MSIPCAQIDRELHQRGARGQEFVRCSPTSSVDIDIFIFQDASRVQVIVLDVELAHWGSIRLKESWEGLL